MRVLLSVLLLAVVGCTSSPDEPAAPPLSEVDLSAHFPRMEATFVVEQAETGQRWVYNPERAAQRFTPASTFKIPHTLVALETGAVDGPGFTVAWDSLTYPPTGFWPDAWRGEQTLRSAFENSVVWVYRTLVQRIGRTRMQAYLDRFDYGNRTIGDDLDLFWLNGELRISPDEQIAFLQRLRTGKLGVSPRTRTIMADLMLLEDTTAYRLRGKTGTANLTPTRELGWLVGWLKRGDEVFYYALNMEGERVWEDWPPQQRAILVRRLFADLDLLGRGAEAAP